MTTAALPPNTPVVHPLHGVGLALRMWGNTEVEVQWPGQLHTRREALGDVERYVPPAPVQRRRRSSAAS